MADVVLAPSVRAKYSRLGKTVSISRDRDKFGKRTRGLHQITRERMHNVLREDVSLHGRPGSLASRTASVNTNKSAYEYIMERQGGKEDVHLEVELLWTVLHSGSSQKNEVISCVFAEEVEKRLHDGREIVASTENKR